MTLTQPTSIFLPMPGIYLPPASPSGGLLAGESDLIGALSVKLTALSSNMLRDQLYYDGGQRMTNLGISVPPSLAGIRTVVDWPRICVDPLVERAEIDGFWIPGQNALMTELDEIFGANDMQSEFPLAVQDSLTLGRGYMIVGAPDYGEDSPIVTVESPFNLSCNWDPRTRQVTAAYQSYEVEGVYRAVLYLPDVTVSMSRDQSSQWMVDDRDEHNFGEVPVVRMPNRSRTADREGRSEITPAVRSSTDRVCRTLLGMEIAREFYAIPQKYALGVNEDDFVNADGTTKTAWDAAMNKFLMLERDDAGDLPTVGQFKAMDPSVFTKMLDEEGMFLSSYTGFPADYFGVVSTANPASADAIRASNDRLNRRARKVQRQNNAPAKTVQRLAWRTANGGKPAPKELNTLEIDWTPVETQTPSATSDALLKQKQAGFVTSGSRVALRALGYTTREIIELLADQKADAANQEVTDIASDLEATQIRTAMTLQKDQTVLEQPPTAPLATAKPVSPVPSGT